MFIELAHDYKTSKIILKNHSHKCTDKDKKITDRFEIRLNDMNQLVQDSEWLDKHRAFIKYCLDKAQEVRPKIVYKPPLPQSRPPARSRPPRRISSEEAPSPELFEGTSTDQFNMAELMNS